VKGLVLISPCDDVALQHDATKERASELLDLAKQLISDGKGTQLMPDGSYYSYLMSAKTFYDYFGPNADQDVFRYRKPDDEFQALASITVPIFVTFGGKNDAVLIPVGDACDLLKRKAINCPNFSSALIDGATHSYLGQEEPLAKEIMNWVGKLW
jgi:pimeloyl-ACP methyl ester carboxylesterase